MSRRSINDWDAGRDIHREIELREELAALIRRKHRFIIIERARGTPFKEIAELVGTTPQVVQNFIQKAKP